LIYSTHHPLINKYPLFAKIVIKGIAFVKFREVKEREVKEEK
jgi:hypothetical protein